MTNIYFYEQVMPTPVAKAAPTPWEGSEGERARQLGVRTAPEFAVFKTIEDECQRSKAIGAHLTSGEIARRLRASSSGVDRILNDLLLRGVIREETGMLGASTLVISKATGWRG